jgi:hypothetical protein
VQARVEGNACCPCALPATAARRRRPPRKHPRRRTILRAPARSTLACR